MLLLNDFLVRDVSVPAKAVEAYLDLRRVVEDHVRVSTFFLNCSSVSINFFIRLTLLFSC